MQRFEKIERGKRRPSKQMAKMLADYFHIPPTQRETFLHAARGGSDDESRRTEDEGSANLGPPFSHPHQRPTHNLPTQLTSFVGRQAELPRIRDLMLASEARPLTLTGPPGTGKTRLALQVAR